VIELSPIELAALIERSGGPDDRFAHQAGECQHAEAVAHPAQGLAAGDWVS